MSSYSRRPIDSKRRWHPAVPPATASPQLAQASVTVAPSRARARDVRLLETAIPRVAVAREDQSRINAFEPRERGVGLLVVGVEVRKELRPGGARHDVERHEGIADADGVAPCEMQRGAARGVPGDMDDARR